METKILDFTALKEKISANNVLTIAECIAFAELKFVLSRAGGNMYRLFSDLYADIKHKTDLNHVLSDGYELVQTGALFLCGYFGKTLSDILYFDKKGKPITIEILCCRQVLNTISKMNIFHQRHISIDELTPSQIPYLEITVDTKQDYTIYDKIVEALELTENMRLALEYRIAGLSYPQIGKMLSEAQSTVFEYFIKMRKKYVAEYL